MSRVAYTPPSTGGMVKITTSCELGGLILGFLGTISQHDLRDLDLAVTVRWEIFEVHRDLNPYIGNAKWVDRGRDLRFGLDKT